MRYTFSLTLSLLFGLSLTPVLAEVQSLNRSDGLLQQVEVSTVTGNQIEFDKSSGMALVSGDARLVSSSGTFQADLIEVRMGSKDAFAKGHVIVNQASGTLTGSEAHYNWAASTGIILNAVGHSPPWLFESKKLNQMGPGLFEMEEGDIRTCNENPPHYHIESSRTEIRVGKRATMKNARFVADEVPVFWTPFYTRSLVPKKYTLRLEPGQTSRDGFTNRTIFGYPFTPHSRTKLSWDYLERTGNGAGIEHDYFLPDVKGSLDSYYIRDTNPDILPQSRRYSVFWNHYQKIFAPLTLNSKIDFKSDQTFGNQFQSAGNNIKIENQVRGLFSEVGLNYQFPKAAIQAQLDRRDKFDSTVSSSNFISKLTLPRLSFNTVPLSFKYLPFYTSFSGSYVNETLTRTTPLATLRYQRSATINSQIRKDLKIKRNLTVTPLLSYEQTWQDRDLTLVNSEEDIYVGRTSVGSNIRQRVGRSTDLNANYTYKTRFRRNQTVVDSQADDGGVETNFVGTSIENRFGYSNRITLTSGYDFRDAPKSFPQKYIHLSERITSPSLDIQLEPRKNIGFNFRETYRLFDASNQSSVRTPANTSGEIQFGRISELTYFSQGFSYTKPVSGDVSRLIFTNKLKFFLTPKWYVDCFLSYQAVAPQNRTNYKKFFPIERTVRLVRDMHCWLLRMEFSKRPGFSEASFYIDLKANLTNERNLFSQKPEDAFYKTREDLTDLSEIFPAIETSPAK